MSKAGLFFVLIAGLLSSCEQIRSKLGAPGSISEDRIAVARVKDKFLYMDEIQGLSARGLTAQDSLDIIERFTDSWVRKQVLITKAGEVRGLDDSEIERKVQEYRYSLLAYEYQRGHISQHLDTLLTSAELEGYYQEHKESFRLKHPIVRGRYLKVPLDAPGVEKIGDLLRSDKQDDQGELSSYAARFAVAYFLDTKEWHDFNDIVRVSPSLGFSNTSSWLKSNKVIANRDDQYHYLMVIKEYKLEGETAPLSYVHHQVRNIIINKRKVNLINALEDEVYNEAKQNKEFDIYGQF